MRPLVHEIFTEFKKAKTKADKIAVLRKHNSYGFKEFLNYAFNPKIKFDIAEIPKYKESVIPDDLNETWLLHEVTHNLYVFIPNHPKYTAKLTPSREKAKLAGLLESLHKEEAKILVDLVQKKLKVDGLTPKLIIEAFPDIPL